MKTLVNMGENNKENKHNQGAMQIKGGKIRMFLDGAWVDFGILYVASDMLRISKSTNLRHSIYVQKIKQWAKELDREGLFSIQSVQTKLKSFWGSSEQWMAQDCKIWHSWLQQIWQFRKCTGKRDSPIQKESNEKYRGNYDNIFKKG